MSEKHIALTVMLFNTGLMAFLAYRKYKKKSPDGVVVYSAFTMFQLYVIISRLYFV